MSGMHPNESRVGLTTSSPSPSGGEGEDEVSSLNNMATAIDEYGLNMDVELHDASTAHTTPLGVDPHSHVVVHHVEGGVKSKGGVANTFAAKKTVAQGMMDIALITANANQLRYLLEFGQASSAYYLVMVLISSSLLIQVVVGMALIFKGRYDLTGDSKHERAIQLNNVVVVGVFMVTIINVFVASFSFSSPDKPAPPPPVAPDIPALAPGGAGYAT